MGGFGGAVFMLMGAWAVGALVVLCLAAWVVGSPDRPRADKWAAWSLFLGMASPLGLFGADGAGGALVVFAVLCLLPIPIGIKALLMGGSKWMAVPGIVLGGITLVLGVFVAVG